MENSVQNILNFPFEKRPREDQLKIMERGKPRPPLPNLICIHKDKKGEYTRRFSPSQYESVEWMTGCDFRSKLYCWPCLLFCTETGVWNEQGFTDLNHLTAAQQRHEKSQTHVQSLFAYTMFEKRIDSDPDHEVTLHNEDVKRNRETLKRIIDAACFLSKDLCCTVNKETEVGAKKVNTEIEDSYLEFFNVLRNYDPFSDIQLNNNNGAFFHKTFTAVLNDIIKGIFFLVKNHIKDEISSAQFVSLILDKTRGDQSNSQFSTILRFVQDGKIKERFIGIVDINNDNTLNGLFKHITGLVEEFQIGDKLSGLTYNGAIEHIKDLQSTTLNVYPFAIFTPCYANELNYELQRGLSIIKECNLFFKVLQGLRAYFTQSQKRIHILYEFINRKQQTIKWSSLYGVCSTLRQDRHQFIYFFESLLENCEQWDHDTLVKATGFLSFLREFKTIVLLEIFSKLFESTEILQTVLKNRPYEMQYCYIKVNDVLKQFNFEKNHGFEDLWISVLNSKYDIEEKLAKRIKCESVDDEKQVYFTLYQKIISNICLQIESRYSSLLKLEYFLLLHSENYEEYKSKFPDNLLGFLKSYYGSKFDYVRLKNELSVLYSSLEFANKNVLELLEFINKNNLIPCFKEIHKLGELVLTIPISVPPEESLSSLQRMKAMHENDEIQGGLHECDEIQGGLHEYSFLSFEKDLVKQLRQQEDFYSNVIQQLPTHDNLTLSYK